MQQLLPAPTHTNDDARKLVEDFHRLLGVARRGWRLIVFCVLMCLTLAGIYLARKKATYRASARLLVLQQGGQPLLNVAGNAAAMSSLAQSTDGYSNFLSTHTMLIRSPLIVGRALDSAGLAHLPVREVTDRITAKLPDETARVVEIEYASASRDEATRVVDAVIASYEQFLRCNFQKNSNEAVALIIKARDELSQELKDLERGYLKYREENPTYSAEEKGRTFVSRRLDRWDQETNDLQSRILQLRTQLDLVRRLADQGEGPATITNAINRLEGGERAAAIVPESAGTLDVSYRRLEDELAAVESRAERLSSSSTA